MPHIKELTEDEFVDLYCPVRNHINPNASFDWGGGFGTLFETYGEEFDYVRQQEPKFVWTLLSGEFGDHIANGMHFVNRLGYFLTEIPHDPKWQLEIPLEFVA